MKNLGRRILLTAAVVGLVLPWRAPPSLGGDKFDGRQFHSGEELYNWCRSNDPTDRQACEVYVCGVLDTWTTAYLDSRASPYRICIRGRPECRELSDAVLKYLEEHPADRHAPAAEVTEYALQQAFICP